MLKRQKSHVTRQAMTIFGACASFLFEKDNVRPKKAKIGKGVQVLGAQNPFHYFPIGLRQVLAHALPFS